MAMVGRFPPKRLRSLLLPVFLGALALLAGCDGSADPGEPPTSSPLVRALERLPLDFKEKGVWFGDVGRALAIAGWPGPLGEEELQALERSEFEAYLWATNGIVLDTSISGRPQEQWEDTFGFNLSDISLSVRTGEFSTDPQGAALLEGIFDSDIVRRRLQDLGYKEESAAGRTYYTIRGDYEMDYDDPGSRLAISQMNRVFVEDGMLIRTGATDEMVGILEAWAGHTPSLADDPAFASLAATLGDPLSAVLLTSPAVLETERLHSPPEYRKQRGWGVLHEWDALGVGYEVTDDGGRSFIFSLFYADPDAAASDGDELVQRMEGYETAVQFRDSPAHPIAEYCDSLPWSHAEAEGGSTLTVRCTLKADTSGLRRIDLVEVRDLGFLLPN
jgi:hypothetical protein